MANPELFPYYHPTSVVLVDDDAGFLESFAFRFGDHWQCETFSDPSRALDFVTQREAQRQGVHRFISRTGTVPEGGAFQRGDQLVGFHSSQITSLLGEADRFGQISVMLVDYDMPSTTGLELCEQLSKTPIRKILLTGKLGRESAVDAFNASLIDGFLEKQAPDLSTQLLEQVSRLQRDYFSGTTGAVGSLHALDCAAYLEDPVFETFFTRTIVERDVVEYYAISKPEGILMGHSDGSLSLLRVYGEAERLGQYEIALAQEAPTELVCLLEEGAVTACFPTQSGYFEEGVREDWRSYVFPAHVLHGKSTWHFSLIQAEKLQIDFLKNVVSYFDFRNRELH